MCSHIRRSPDRSLFAAPRGLSQLVTSFFGSWCQGIRPVLLFAWTSYSSLVLFMNCLSFFVKQDNIFNFAIKRFSFNLFPPFGEIVVLLFAKQVTLNLERLNLFLKLCPLYLFVFSTHFKSKYLNLFFTYSIVKFHFVTLTCDWSVWMVHHAPTYRVS